MARWEPDAAGRLRQAALELFEEQGYEGTTVAEIADRAGVSSRTFFRHYADKRDVLFGGGDQLVDLVSSVVADAPEHDRPSEVIGAALDAVTGIIGSDRSWGRRRNAVVTATPELLERELVKLARLARTIAEGLRARGVDARDSELAGEAAMAALRVGFARWVDAPDERSLAELVRSDLARLGAITGG
jgi:AcrR family transcriptional regulator